MPRLLTSKECATKAQELVQRVVDFHADKGEQVPAYSGTYHLPALEMAQVYAILSQAAAIRERYEPGGGPG